MNMGMGIGNSASKQELWLGSEDIACEDKSPGSGLKAGRLPLFSSSCIFAKASQPRRIVEHAFGLSRQGCQSLRGRRFVLDIHGGGLRGIRDESMSLIRCVRRII